MTARAEGFSSVTKLCVVGYQSGATACSFNLAKSNWDRIKQVRHCQTADHTLITLLKHDTKKCFILNPLQIMALHGNKPIRLSYGTTRAQNPTVVNGNRRVVDVNSGYSPNLRLSAEQQRRLRIARLRRRKQQRLMRSRLTTLPPTTTTPTTTTTIPTTPEITTSWYDLWLIGEGQSSTAGGFTDSTLDFNYEYKIDDY